MLNGNIKNERREERKNGRKVVKTIRQFINKSGNDVRHTIVERERERDDKFKKQKKCNIHIFVYIAHPIVSF